MSPEMPEFQTRVNETTICKYTNIKQYYEIVEDGKNKHLSATANKKVNAQWNMYTALYNIMHTLLNYAS